MLYPFFVLGAQSVGRQRVFREAVAFHVIFLGGCFWALESELPHELNKTLVFVGQFALIAGIVEGAALVGWRLAQMPKSQALEFLLVSPLQPRRLFFAEALVGLSRLALVALAGMPILMLMVFRGYIYCFDVIVLTVMPLTWGAITGIGLTAWAYEPKKIRRWAERFMLAGIIFYIGFGLLIGEKIFLWVSWMPPWIGRLVLNGFEAFHRYNPFRVMEFWLRENMNEAMDRMAGLELCGLAVLGLSLTRAAFRLKGHFHERHYRPAVDESKRKRKPVGNHPLSWWAVKRVTEYSGRINLWLAGGFGLIYAFYTVFENYWPPTLGREVFNVFAKMGGIPGLATGLIVLAAVPAAYQYGLWDSNTQDRCRRLELLLLTDLEPRDYWHAAAAAAWNRGRGYFLVAMTLWLAAAIAGKASVLQLGVALAASIILCGLYFTLGFRAFSTGKQANSLGSILTLGLPFITYILFTFGWPALGALVPPGSVYAPAAGLPDNPWLWLPGPLIGALAGLWIARVTLENCDTELRRWYDLNHGQKVVD